LVYLVPRRRFRPVAVEDLGHAEVPACPDQQAFFTKERENPAHHTPADRELARELEL
jgi:hypothetical protein